MPEFTLPKSIDDIQEGVVAPDGTYKFITTRIELLPNKAGTGNNIQIDLTVTGEQDEKLNGITQTLYLPMPNPSDEGKTIKTGQPMVDWKMENIKGYVEALGGTMKGDKFDIPENSMCKYNLTSQLNQESGKQFNVLEGRIMSYKPGKTQVS